MIILNIIKNDIKRMTRERGIMILTFLMPVMLILIFGNLNFGDGNSDPKFPVAITNLDSSSSSQELVNELKNDKAIYIVDLNKDELYKQVKDSDVTVGFIIPENFGKRIVSGQRPEIKVVKLPSSSDYPVIEGIVNSAYLKLSAKSSIVGYFARKINFPEDKKKAALDSIEASAGAYLNRPSIVGVDMKYHLQKEVRKVSQKASYMVSFSIVFVMWAVVFAAGEILIERKLHTWDRLNIAPVSKAAIITGKISGTFVRGWIQVAFLIVFSKLVMGLDWGKSMVMTLITVSIFLLCVTSFGMFLAAMVTSFQQLAAMSAIIITCSSMLAGCYWPLEIMPQSMQQLAKIFPQYWAMKGLTANLENLGISSLKEPILVLTGMGLLFLILSISLGKLKIRKLRKQPGEKIA